METKGKLIVIEGGDGTGKETQSKLLFEKLKEYGINTSLWTFPDYESYWGRQVRRYLEGDFGDIKGSGAYFPALLYALDREKAADALNGLLWGGITVVCDRYIASNLAYQGVKIPDLQERDKFNEWMLDVEYNEFGSPKPDLTIILELTTEVEAKRIKERNQKLRVKDMHEENMDFMEQVAAEYRRLAQKYSWPRINCCNRQGEQLSREEISDKILQTVTSTFEIGA